MGGNTPELDALQILSKIRDENRPVYERLADTYIFRMQFLEGVKGKENSPKLLKAFDYQCEVLETKTMGNREHRGKFLEKIGAYIDALRRTGRSYEEEIGKLVKEKNGMSDELGKCRDSVEKVKKYEEELAKLTEEKDTLGRQLSSIKNEMEDRDRKNLEKITKCEGEITTYKGFIGGLQDVERKHSEEIAGHKAEIAKCQAQIETDKQIIKSLQGSIEELKKAPIKTEALTETEQLKPSNNS